MMMEVTNASRILPCTRCGYDLRGRMVGEQCPECGWTIDAAGPIWWDSITLERMRSMAMLARVPCLLLLLVPSLFVVAVIRDDSRNLLPATLFTFLVLMPVQVIAQCVATLIISARNLGGDRSAVLRMAALARLSAFLAAAAVLAARVFWPSARVAEFVTMAFYFTLPLVAVASDIVTLRVLAGLRKECDWLLPAGGRVIPSVARALMWGVYPLLIVPIVGWFFAPIIWTVAMSICFAELRRVADAARAVRRT
jgi:hypothetical protein